MFDTRSTTRPMLAIGRRLRLRCSCFWTKCEPCIRRLMASCTTRDKEIEMYIRNVRIKLRANCAPEFTRILEAEIIPLLRQQEGFQDEIFFVAPKRNEAIAISFWDRQVNAEAYNHVAYLDVLKLLSKVVEAMPVVETFEGYKLRLPEIAARAV